MPQAWVRETPVASLELDDFRTAGAVHGRTLADATRSKRVRARLRRRTRALRSLFTGVEAHPSTRPHREWLSENGRLLATSVKDVQHLVESASVLPAFTDATGTELRVCRLARVYLERADWRYDDEQSLAFLRGACAGAGLTLGEIWAMKPALQICLLERLLSEKRQELDHQLTMLSTRNTAAFKAASLLQYGTVGSQLLAEAHAILARPRGRKPRGEKVGAV